MSEHLASVTWRAAALSSRRRLAAGSALELARAFAALALAAKQTLLEIADLGLSPVELSTKRCLALRGRFLYQRERRVERRVALLGVLALLRHESLGAVLQLLQSRHRSLVQRLPTPGLHHQLDVRQLGQSHDHLGERRRVRLAHRRDRIQLNRLRFHGSERYGKTLNASSDFGAAKKRIYGSTECLQGMTATVSSIHINGWFGAHDKLSAPLVHRLPTQPADFVRKSQIANRRPVGQPAN